MSSSVPDNGFDDRGRREAIEHAFEDDGADLNACRHCGLGRGRHKNPDDDR